MAPEITAPASPSSLPVRQTAPQPAAAADRQAAAGKVRDARARQQDAARATRDALAEEQRARERVMEARAEKAQADQRVREAMAEEQRAAAAQQGRGRLVNAVA